MSCKCVRWDLLENFLREILRYIDLCRDMFKIYIYNSHFLNSVYILIFKFKKDKLSFQSNMEVPQIDEEEMQIIYNWVDEIPLSRPKRNIARDFSDGGKLSSLSSQFFLILLLNSSVG